MTYLQVVNQVLRRLREDEVNAVNTSAYSKMVGDFVNDAYKLVSNAWDWSSLWQDIEILTAEGVSEYPLTGASQGAKVQTAYNVSQKAIMQYFPLAVIRHRYITDAAKGSPGLYTFTSTTEGVPQIKVYPEPDQEYTLSFNTVVRSDLLENNDDPLRVPHLPVVHLTLGLLARERGETGGTSAPEYFGIADQYLADAVALDANRSPEKLTWEYI